LSTGSGSDRNNGTSSNTGVVVGAVVAARSIVSIINVLVGICISRQPRASPNADDVFLYDDQCWPW
jgi:hypothetical protein